jgi:hypothetical protein
MYIDVEGGSHLIASVIADLYSPNFKMGLAQWLESIPQFPKPGIKLRVIYHKIFIN